MSQNQQATDFREQLRHMKGSIKRTYSTVQPVSQVVLTLRDNDPDTLFDEARRIALRWMNNRAGRPLPEKAWEGHDFDLTDVGAQRASAAVLDEPRYWTARIDDADKEVPQRQWSTEIGIGINKNEEVLFGCRLQCVTRGEWVDYQPTVPGVVRQIIETGKGYLDDIPIRLEPFFISDQTDLQALISLINNPDRAHDIMVFSRQDDGGFPTDPYWYARNLAGTTHTMVIDPEPANQFRHIFGGGFTCWGGGIRTFCPGFDPEIDSNYDHPLALPSRIAGWSGGEPGFREFIANTAIKRTVRRRDLEAAVPSYSQVSSIALKRKSAKAREEGESESELLDMALEEVNKKDQEIADIQDKAITEQLQLQEENEELQRQIHTLRARIQYLEATQQSAVQDEPTPIPDSLAELSDWAAKHLGGSVVILNRALRAAKKSPFQDSSLVYKALLVLRDYYIPMRAYGGLDQKRAYEEQLRQLGIDESNSIQESHAGEQGDAYNVNYGGRRQRLDRHLRYGATKDDRSRCVSTFSGTRKTTRSWWVGYPHIWTPGLHKKSLSGPIRLT